MSTGEVLDLVWPKRPTALPEGASPLLGVMVFKSFVADMKYKIMSPYSNFTGWLLYGNLSLSHA